MIGTARPAHSTEPHQSFEEFFRSEYPRLARACLLLTGDRGEAEELAQEAMARVYERWDRVRAMNSPDGYVYRTAANLNRKRLRRLAVRARHAIHTREVQVEGADTRNEVLDALRSLPVGQRTALVLIGWLGFTAEETGRLLGIRPVSVRARLHRGRASLRDLLGGDDG